MVGIKLTNLAMVGKIPNCPGVERGIILVSATPARAPIGSGLKLIIDILEMISAAVGCIENGGVHQHLE